MNKSINLVVYPVKDLDQAKALYTTLLGVEPYADAPYYVGYRVGDQEIGLDPNGHKQGLTGPLPYWPVDNIKQSLQDYVAAGAEVVGEPKDVGGGKMVATIKDADGNVTGLVQEPA